jgi:O-antigen/teichoic acid export membrane protein
MIKGFLKDAAKYLPSQVVPGIIGFVTIPIITRLFAPEDYGSYSLVMATVMILVTLVGWLSMSIIRFYPAYERDNKLDFFCGNIIKLTFISILVITLIFIILLFSLRTYLSSKLYLLMSVGICVFVVMSMYNVFQHFLRSMRQVGWYSFLVSWKSVMAFVLGLGLIVLFKFGIEGLLWGIILSEAVIFPLLWIKAVGGLSITFVSLDIPLVKEMARYSFPLVIGNLAAWILSLSDRYILEFFRGSREVGLYSASYNISEKSIMLLVTLFMLASGPLSVHVWEKEGREKSAEFISKITRYYFIVCIPAVIGLSVLSRPIIKIMTGELYFEGYKIMAFVTLGVLFLGLQQRFQAGFLFYKKTSFVTITILSSGLLNLLLNFLFVPRYGYYAAAVTTLVSYAFLLFLVIIFSRHLFPWQFPFRSSAKVIIASAIMGIVVYFIGGRLTSSDLLNVFLGVCSGVLVYSIMLFLLREFQPNEKEAMKQLLKRCMPFGLIFGG